MEISALIQPLNNVLAIVSVIFGCFIITRLFKRQWGGEAKKKLLVIFGLIVSGSLLFSIAEILYSLFLFSGSVPVNVPDFLWFIGYVLMFSGFTYFNIYILGDDDKLGKGMSIISIVTILLGAFVYYLVSLGIPQELSSLDKFFIYFFPIASTVVLVSSSSVYFLFRNFPDVAKPILFFSIAGLFDFAGNMFSVQAAPNMPSLLAGLSFTLSYLSVMIGYYKLK